MKRCLNICTVLAVVAVCVASVSAMPASELRNLTVTEHIFTTQVLTVNGFLRTDDPDTLRFLVIRVDATRADAGETSIFAHDFAFSYQVPGENGPEEQRAGIEAIAVGGQPWDFGFFLSGIEPRVSVEGTSVSIGLVGFIESNVTSVTLGRVGTAETVTIDLSQDQPRRFSVYLSTSQGEELGNKGVAALRNQGLDAHLSLALDPEIEGCEVQYGQHAETAAREAAAALKGIVGREFTVTQLDDDTMMCEYDILVRIGKPAAGGGGGVKPNPL